MLTPTGIECRHNGNRPQQSDFDYAFAFEIMFLCVVHFLSAAICQSRSGCRALRVRSRKTFTLGMFLINLQHSWHREHGPQLSARLHLLTLRTAYSAFSACCALEDREIWNGCVPADHRANGTCRYNAVIAAPGIALWMGVASQRQPDL